MFKADETTTSRRDLLTRVVAGAALASATGVNVVAIGATRSTMPDPVLAVIYEHREAQEELQAACDANGLDMEDCPRKLAASIGLRP
jgi:hypothetical protein